MTRSSHNHARASVEHLEPRALLDAVFWDGGAGTMSWQDPGNWNRNGVDQVPQHSDDVIIDVGGETPIIFNNDSVNLDSLITNTPIRVEGGTFGLNGVADINAPFYAAGGDLWGGTWDVTDAALHGHGSDVYNITVLGDILLDEGSLTTHLTVHGTTRFGRAILTGGNTSIRFDSGYVLHDEIIADGPSNENRWVTGSYDGAGAFTIGPTGLIRVSEAFQGTLGVGASGGGPFVNNGVIRSDAANGTLSVGGPTFTNNGEIVVNDGVLRLSAGWQNAWTNAGTITATNSEVFLLDGWSNQTGTINLVGSTLKLNGNSTTPGLGTINRTDSTIELRGTLDNSGDTLSFNNSTGDWNLLGGSISGGVIEFSDARGLNFTPTGGFLIDVQVNGDLTLDEYQDVVEVRGSTRFGVARLLGPSSGIRFGTGYVLMDSILAQGDFSGNFISGATTGQGTLTIGPTGVIRIPANSGGNLGIGGNDSTLINNGLIAIEAADRTITLGGRAVLNNAAIIATAGTVAVATYPVESFANAGQISVSDATLTLNDNWENTGTINATNSIVNLGGTFETGDLGTFNRAGGVVNLNGIMVNTGHTLHLDAVTGSWNLVGGWIQGGALSWQDGARLHFTAARGQLSGVAVLGDILLDTPGAQVLVSESTRFSAARLTAPDTIFTMAGDYVLRDAVSIEGETEGLRSVTAGVFTGDAVTIAPEALIRVAADSPGDLTIDGAGTLVNNALIAIDAPDAILTIAPSSWTNTGSIIARNGTVNLGGTFTTDAIGLLDRTGSVVNLTGTLNNTDETLAFDDARGSWNLAGGTINSGMMNFNGKNRLHLTPAGGTLNNLQITTPVLLDAAGATVTVNGTTRFPSLTLGADGATLRIGTSYTLLDEVIAAGSGTVERTIASLGNAFITIGASGSIRLATGSGSNLAIRTGVGGRITNQGSIRSDAAGRDIVITSRSLTNQGLVSIAPGARIVLSATYSQTSAAVLDIGVSGAGDSEIGVLLTNQSATRAGTLRITAVNGWVPDRLNSVFLSAASFGGQFSTTVLPKPPAHHQSFVLVNGATLRLVISPTSDFNRDGNVNSQDYFDFLAAFFSDGADFNADGVSNSQDYFDFLAVFFGG